MAPAIAGTAGIVAVIAVRFPKASHVMLPKSERIDPPSEALIVVRLPSGL